MDAMTFVVMAGGTGGHVFPGLAVADELCLRGHKVAWMGSSSGIEGRVAPKAGYDICEITYCSPRGRGRIRALLDLWRAVREATRSIRRLRPSLLIGMGGYMSVPGGLAGRRAGVPLVIHEQNALAGKANRLLARFAKRSLVGYPGSFGGSVKDGTTVHVGNPVRKGFSEAPEPDVRIKGRSGPLRILVVGGSQGSQFLNERIPEVVAEMDAGARPEVVHQCGAGNRGTVENAYLERSVQATVHEFIDDMARAMAEADLMVSRCGAATLAEMSAVGLGSVLVPYPHATEQHQLMNARHFENEGAGIVVEQSGFDAAGLARRLAGIGRGETLRMAQAARRVNPADSARRIVDLCEEVARAV